MGGRRGAGPVQPHRSLHGQGGARPAAAGGGAHRCRRPSRGERGGRRAGRCARRAPAQPDGARRAAVCAPAALLRRRLPQTRAAHATAAGGLRHVRQAAAAPDAVFMGVSGRHGRGHPVWHHVGAALLAVLQGAADGGGGPPRSLRALPWSADPAGVGHGGRDPRLSAGAAGRIRGGSDSAAPATVGRSAGGLGAAELGAVRWMQDVAALRVCSLQPAHPREPRRGRRPSDWRLGGRAAVGCPAALDVPRLPGGGGRRRRHR
mmetsp:Transcript_10563/g.35052  ORF Transcript_10563/g.35052 Transcript_10563/m.35052 type:complete len:262 (+) Transcript_10563:951-1736(+)